MAAIEHIHMHAEGPSFSPWHVLLKGLQAASVEKALSQPESSCQLVSTMAVHLDIQSEYIPSKYLIGRFRYSEFSGTLLSESGLFP